MKERPIIMDGGSIRAILDGRKVQTRRIIKPQIEDAEGYELRDALWYPYDYPGGRGERVQCYDALHCPYGVPGDRLWVQETWRVMGLMYEDEPCVQYKADMAEQCCSVPDDWLDTRWEDWYERQSAKLVEDCERAGLTPEEPYSDVAYRWERDACPTRWQSPIHMPKFAARLWLEVIGVRAERLNDISVEDARAEGIRMAPKRDSFSGWHYMDLLETGDDGKERCGYDETEYVLQVGPFASLWDSLNAKKGHPWSANDWAWVISFKVVS